MMGFRKAYLLFSLLFFLQLQDQFTHSNSRSALFLASVEPNHDNLPVHAGESKPNGVVIAENLTELVVVVKKGGGGGGGRGGGGGGRSFGGGGRSYGGSGRSYGRGGREGGERGGRSRGGIIPIAITGGSSHGAHRSNGVREIAGGWLGLSIGLVLVYLRFLNLFTGLHV